MAEAIKYGCIYDAPLFERLGQERAGDFLEEMIFSCVDSKRRIVEEDERESGRRMLLNFGHTLGHAIENTAALRVIPTERPSASACFSPVRPGSATG